MNIYYNKHSIEKEISITPSEQKKLISEAVKAALAEHEASKSDLPIRQYIPVEEAAKYLGIAKNTLYQYTSSNYIPFIKFGRRVQFIKEELDGWILKHRQKNSRGNIL